MLAQSFKTAEELRITPKQFDALAKTLVLMETGKLVHVDDDEIHSSENNYNLPIEVCRFTGHFNMNLWRSKDDCGTVCCIGGTAELIGNVIFAPEYLLPAELKTLFYPNDGMNDNGIHYNDITVEQAATALRSYLTTGKANWESAIG